MQSKYDVIGIVGEGAYGVVYKCRSKETGEFVAIKKFKEIEDDIVKKTMTRELKVLQMLKHENIVEYKEAFKRKGNLFLVFEYVDKNLLELLQENGKGLDPLIIKKIIYQLCKAIKYLHEMNIVHRDIKPENLLVDSNLKLKLCDFGFARMIKKNNEKLTDYVATRWYRSPELLITSGYYGPEIDYWAIGCIMGELADGDALFPGDNEIDQLNLIQKVIGRLPDHQLELFYKNQNFKGKRLVDVAKPETLERRYFGKLSKKALEFMKELLHPDPVYRLKGDSVLSHPYFDNFADPFPSQIKVSIPKQHNLNTVSSNNHIPDIIGKNQTQNTEKKNKLEQPIITNTTNINIINYNNFDNKGMMSENNIKNDSNQKNPKIGLKNTFSHNKIPTNNFSNNLVLTSYNFNQAMKDNIINMYSSTAFDKNFKTFYKGDPYNFDLDMNFLKDKESKIKKDSDLNIVKTNLDLIEKERSLKGMYKNNTIKKQTFTNFNNDKSPNKNKKIVGGLKNLNYLYNNHEDAYTYKQKNMIPKNIGTNIIGTSNVSNNPVFQLPSIHNKNIFLKKVLK